MSPFFIACRPKTLIASISPVCIAAALAISEQSFHPFVFLLTLLTGLGIQIVTNLVNDLFDFLKGADTPLRKGPTRVIASGLMSIQEMKKAIVCVTCATLFLGLSLAWRGGPLVGALLPLSLLIAFCYTAGPFPLAYLGIAEFFVLIFFGPLATGMTYYLQTLTFSSRAFVMGIGPGLFSCSILVLNNLRDIEEDQHAGKKTLVARLGIPFGKWEYSFSLFLACLVPLLTYDKHPLQLLPILILFPTFLLIHAVMKNTSPSTYTLLFEKTGKLFAYYTLITSLSFII